MSTTLDSIDAVVGADQMLKFDSFRAYEIDACKARSCVSYIDVVFTFRDVFLMNFLVFSGKGVYLLY